MSTAVKQGLRNNVVGHGFEQTVANWAKYYFRNMAPTTITFAERARGLTCSMPYDVDVRVNCKGGGILGFFKDEYDIWIEAKFKTDKNVKRADVQKLIGSAQDVWRGYKNNIGIGYNVLVMAANRDFDSDALQLAISLDVLCVVLKDGHSASVIKSDKWLDEPAWLPKED
jgi:hypothetical protein